MRVDTKSMIVLKKIFKDTLNVDITITEDEMSKNDFYFTWKGNEWIGESKVRRFNKDKYPETLINKDKYQFLIKNNSMLCIFFYDGLYVCQDIKKAYKYEKDVYCKDKTDFDGGKYCWSTKVYLDLSKFKKIDIEDSMLEWIYK